MNKRIIKDIINVDSNSSSLHPILNNLMFNDTNEPLCLTKLNLKNNNSVLSSKYKCKNNDSYNNYLYIPPISISSDDILSSYNIDTINELEQLIDEKIHNIKTIERLINCWIIVNIDTLKKHNHILSKLINSFTDVYKLIIIKENIKKIDSFIEYWLSNFETNYSKLFIQDLFDYLKKQK